MERVQRAQFIKRVELIPNVNMSMVYLLRHAKKRWKIYYLNYIGGEIVY